MLLELPVDLLDRVLATQCRTFLFSTCKKICGRPKHQVQLNILRTHFPSLLKHHGHVDVPLLPTKFIVSFVKDDFRWRFQPNVVVSHGESAYYLYSGVFMLEATVRGDIIPHDLFGSEEPFIDVRSCMCDGKVIVILESEKCSILEISSGSWTSFPVAMAGTLVDVDSVKMEVTCLSVTDTGISVGNVNATAATTASAATLTTLRRAATAGADGGVASRIRAVKKMGEHALIVEATQCELYMSLLHLGTRTWRWSRCRIPTVQPRFHDVVVLMDYAIVLHCDRMDGVLPSFLTVFHVGPSGPTLLFTRAEQLNYHYWTRFAPVTSREGSKVACSLLRLTPSPFPRNWRLQCHTLGQ